MHILLIHQAFAALDQPGGTRHHELAEHLAGRGHRVTVVASPVSYLTGQREQGTSEVQQHGAVEIRRAFTYPALHRSFFHRLLSFFSFMFSSFWHGLQVRNVDLVWGTSPPLFQGFTAWLLARLKRCPFLFEVRDLWPAFAVQVGVLRQPLLIRLSEWLEGFLYRKADLVVVNSPGFIPHVRARGARRIELVSNGSDPRMFDPALDGSAFRRQHGLEGSFVVMYAGAHGLSNDLGIVLQAAALANSSLAAGRENAAKLTSHQDAGQAVNPPTPPPEIVFVLLGDGKEKPALQAQAREMGLTNLLFLPALPKSGMPLALAAADACLAILKPLPLYSTVYPNKVFDYMAAGRPVLLAIDGAIREVVEGAQAGLFVPPGDPQALASAALQLACDPRLVREMGRNARCCVEEHFDRAQLAEQFARLVEGMVSEKTRIVGREHG